MKLDTNSLAHTKWECKYHIVFAPKYRRQIIYGKIKMDIGQMLRKLCEYKGIEIIEAEACKDHIHMLVSIPPKYSVAQIMGYLKGKSSLMIPGKFESKPLGIVVMLYDCWRLCGLQSNLPGVFVDDKVRIHIKYAVYVFHLCTSFDEKSTLHFCKVLLNMC